MMEAPVAGDWKETEHSSLFENPLEVQLLEPSHMNSLSTTMSVSFPIISLIKVECFAYFPIQFDFLSGVMYSTRPDIITPYLEVGSLTCIRFAALWAASKSPLIGLTKEA
jgi:hypothetical protein